MLLFLLIGLAVVTTIYITIVFIDFLLPKYLDLRQSWPLLNTKVMSRGILPNLIGVITWQERTTFFKTYLKLIFGRYNLELLKSYKELIGIILYKYDKRLNAYILVHVIFKKIDTDDIIQCMNKVEGDILLNDKATALLIKIDSSNPFSHVLDELNYIPNSRYTWNDSKKMLTYIKVKYEDV